MEFTSPVVVIQMMTIWIYFIFQSWNISCLWLITVGVSGCFRAIFIVRNSFLEIQKLAQNEDEAKVCRNGEWSTIPVREIVPGDMIDLKNGPAPCDGVVVQGGCVVNESMLTGEPMPMQKFVRQKFKHNRIDKTVSGRLLALVLKVISQSPTFLHNFELKFIIIIILFQF